MFCSRSKSGQPNCSDELVPQALSTTHELIGRVGENSASRDCRHHHKFNTTALSVTLPITQQKEASFLPDSHFFACYFLILHCHPAQGNMHYTQRTVTLTLELIIPAITNMALSSLKSFLFPARTRQWKLASLMDE